MILSYKNWIRKTTTEAFSNAKYVLLSSGKVHYTDIGDENGEIILHFHGSPAGADVGLYFFEDFIKAGYRIIAMSRPGFLGTDITLGKSIEDQADLYKEFMLKLNIKYAIIHAWSAGGPPALKFAEKYPEMVKGLILYCAVSVPWKHKITFFEKAFLSNAGMYSLYIFSELFPTTFKKKFAKELGFNFDYIRSNEESMKVFERFMGLTSPPNLRNNGSFNDIENYSKMEPFNFEKITTKTLILFSPSDNQLTIDNGDVPAKRMPNCKYIKFEHGGHTPQFDKEWNYLLNEMLLFIKEQTKNEANIK